MDVGSLPHLFIGGTATVRGTPSPSRRFLLPHGFSRKIIEKNPTVGRIVGVGGDGASTECRSDAVPLEILLFFRPRSILKTKSFPKKREEKLKEISRLYSVVDRAVEGGGVGGGRSGLD